MISDELVDMVLKVRQSLYDKKGIVLVTPNRMETQSTLEALVILKEALDRLDKKERVDERVDAGSG